MQNKYINVKKKEIKYKFKKCAALISHLDGTWQQSVTLRSPHLKCACHVCRGNSVQFMLEYHCLRQHDSLLVKRDDK